MAHVSVRNRFLALACLLFVGSSSQAWGQGQIYFSNRVPASGIDARFIFSCGMIMEGPGYTAQLYAGPAGAAESALIPIFPTTTFGTGVKGGYFANPQTVTIPGVAPGQRGVFQVRVWDNAGGTILSWETATFKGASTVFSPAAGLGGPDPNGGPPLLTPDLVGFTSMWLPACPEPGVCALLALGLGPLFGEPG